MIDNKIIPEWSFFYFFKNIGNFKKVAFLSIVLSSIVTFLSYLVADKIRYAINNYQTIDYQLFVLALSFIIVAKEILDYIIRKHGEGFVIRFKDFIRVKLFYDLTKEMPFFDGDPSDFKSALDEYLSTCYYLSSQFVLNLPRRVVGIVMSFVVIASMGTLPVLVNIFALLLFFVVSFFFSRAYVKLNKAYSEKSIALETALSNLFLSVDYVSRNKPVKNYHEVKQGEKWAVYQKVKNLHSSRWLWQLLPFNIIYVISLGFLIQRIQNGQNDLGDLALAQWYYSVLLGVFIFVTESLTDLAKQKAASSVAYNKLSELAFHAPRKGVVSISENVHSGKYIIQGGNGVGKTTCLYDFISRTKLRVSSYFSGEYYPIDYHLSSGELQRKMVDETASNDADVYIFDEPCSHTDSTGWFVDVLNSIQNDRIVFVVSHKEIDYPFTPIDELKE